MFVNNGRAREIDLTYRLVHNRLLTNRISNERSLTKQIHYSIIIKPIELYCPQCLTLDKKEWN